MHTIERARNNTILKLNGGGREMILGERTLVMGILNVTPDSFSDGGRYLALDDALKQARRMKDEGADIIDIGGESTRPQAEAVSLTEELERVIPVIEKIADEIDLPISIDTYKAEVARQAIVAGASLINDVWGGKADDQMASVAAETNTPIILMHNRQDRVYTDLLSDVIANLMESVQLMKSEGVPEHHLLLDPGIGFAKSYEQNIEVMARLEEITALGYPVLLGTSRKSMIGLTLGLPPSERLEGSLATVALGIAKGCSIVRVHDVKETVRTARMIDAIVRRK